MNDILSGKFPRYQYLWMKRLCCEGNWDVVPIYRASRDCSHVYYTRRHLYSSIRDSTDNTMPICRAWHLFRWATTSPLHALPSLFWPVCQDRIFDSDTGLTYVASRGALIILSEDCSNFFFVRLCLQDWLLTFLVSSATAVNSPQGSKLDKILCLPLVKIAWGFLSLPYRSCP